MKHKNYSIMGKGEILPVAEFNRRDIAKWNKEIEEWKNEFSSQPMPQLAFHGFRTQRTGELRKHGFVGYIGGGYRFKKRKKDLMNEIKQMVKW